MEKLTYARIDEILSKKVWSATKEELISILGLLGLRVKEYTRCDKNEIQSCRFEIHYGRYFVIEASADSTNRIVSYGNEFVYFGEGTSGASIPTENVKDFLKAIVVLWLGKLCPEYDGPIFNEATEYAYKTIEEMQLCVEYLQSNLLAD